MFYAISNEPEDLKFVFLESYQTKTREVNSRKRLDNTKHLWSIIFRAWNTYDMIFYSVCATNHRLCIQ
jgi:hypothetical protein